MQVANKALEKNEPSPERETGTRERALYAAAEILRHKGYSQLTMDRVAAVSGVAKTTLYRRWPAKAALCRELYLEIAGQELHDPDTGNIASDLKHITNTVVRLQTRTIAGPAFIGLIAEALSDPESSAPFLADFAEQRRTITSRVIKRGIQRGEVRPETDVDLVIDALGGATTFRLLHQHAPLSRKFVNSLVNLLLSGCKTAQPRDALKGK